MGKETILFKNEEKMSTGNAALLLRTLADKIEKGKVILEKGEKKLKLNIPSQLEVEVKAEKEEGRKRTTMKIEVELEWPLGDGKDTPAPGPMKIR